MPPPFESETEHPGAGTLYVYGNPAASGSNLRRTRASPSPSSRASPTRGLAAGAGAGVVARARERSRLGKRSSSPFGSGSIAQGQQSQSRSGSQRRDGSVPPPSGPAGGHIDGIETGTSWSWDDIRKTREEPRAVASLDSLLHKGIAEYTHIPVHSGGVLGRGKFSTVYKVLGADGEYHALKHTPLYPHHPLISARLLREPTLLSELPTHPCLIGVEGWVRTEGHFYLIENYVSHHVPLPNHPLPLPPSRAAYILDQLVSVVRDCLHDKGRVCHRDLKGDNVLVDVDTGDVVILDLGLATRFSASEPKLTTCCGSPAFHSPEIVHALSRPPGEVTYYGPELDIWCIGLVLLSLLLQVRFPLGPKHTSPYIMRERVMDRLQELDALYPPHAPWRTRNVTNNQHGIQLDADFEKREWRRVRRALGQFLEIDGRRRMSHFKAYDLGEKVKRRLEKWGAARGDEEEDEKRKFKQTSFLPAEVKYTLPIYLEDDEPSQAAPPSNLILHNVLGESERRVTSYIKYLLRSAGILYHVLPTPPSDTFDSEGGSPASTPKSIVMQLVVSVPDAPPPTTTAPSGHTPSTGWFPSLFNLRKGQATLTPDPASSTPAVMATSPRSASVPPGTHRQARAPSPVPLTQTTSGGKKALDRVLRCYIKIDFESVPLSPLHHIDSRPRYGRRASADTFTSFREGLGLSPLLSTQTHSTASTSTSTSTATATTATNLRSVSASRTRNHPGTQSSLGSGHVPRPGTRRTVSHNRVGGWTSSTTAVSPAGIGGSGPLSPRTRATTSLTPLTTTVSGSSATSGGGNGSGSGSGSSEGRASGPSYPHGGSMGQILQPLAPLSPLSRQVSLSSSPPTSTSSRAPSRSSSRSRKTSGPYPATPSLSTAGQSSSSDLAGFRHHQTNGHVQGPGHGQNYNLMRHHTPSTSTSRIIITLSDPRSYPILRKALDVQPDPRRASILMARGGGADSSLLFSPMTIRRPSLAPSLPPLPSVPDATAAKDILTSRAEEEGERRTEALHLHVDIVREIGELDLRAERRQDQEREEEEEEEEEEERGRPRSKEDHSGVYYHLQKVQQAQAQALAQAQAEAEAEAEAGAKLQIREVMERSPTIGGGRDTLRPDSDRISRGRSRPRALLDVLFGSGRSEGRASSLPPSNSAIHD